MCFVVGAFEIPNGSGNRRRERNAARYRVAREATVRGIAIVEHHDEPLTHRKERADPLADANRARINRFTRCERENDAVV